MARTYPNLATFLEETDTTQQAFADEMGVAVSFISMLVRGERQPSLPMALKIASRARIPIESLVAENEGVR